MPQETIKILGGELLIERADGPTEPPPPDPGDLEPSPPILIKDKVNVHIKLKQIVGDPNDTSINFCIRLIRCPGAVIESCDLSRSRFSGLWATDCPGLHVIGGHYHHNGRSKDGSASGRVGHGIYLDGNCDGAIIERAESFANFEDGSQTGPSATGMITYKGAHFHHNMENGLDVKGAKVRLLDPDMHDNGDGRGMEVVILHNKAKEFACAGGRLVVRPGEDNSNCINAANGAGVIVENTLLDAGAANTAPLGGKGSITAIGATLVAQQGRALIRLSTPTDCLLDKCTFIKPDDRNWFAVGGAKYDKALDLTEPGLTVRDGREG